MFYTNWLTYEDVIKLKDDPGFNEAAFEELIEKSEYEEVLDGLIDELEHADFVESIGIKLSLLPGVAQEDWSLVYLKPLTIAMMLF